MKNVVEIHSEHIELLSDIRFYNNEIDFLLRLINGEYKCAFSSREKIKALDAYYIEFEKYKSKLERLGKEIEEHENLLSWFCKEDLVDVEKTHLKDEKEIFNYYYQIIKELKVLKESLYNFISDLHKSV
ncbi:MAG TPA: hypothetical protein VIK89_09390 [Cytophagaceae bacterium]